MSLHELHELNYVNVKESESWPSLLARTIARRRKEQWIVFDGYRVINVFKECVEVRKEINEKSNGESNGAFRSLEEVVDWPPKYTVLNPNTNS